MTVSATIEIRASADKVWAIVTSTASYPSFDPSMVRVIGHRPALNARLAVFTVFREKAFRYRITAFAPPRLMVWTAGGAFGLVKRVRSFAIDEIERNRVRFTLSEEVAGRLRKLARQPGPELAGAFEGFCRGLKELAEA